MCRQVADYSRQCWIVFFVLFGNSVEKIPEGYKRHLVNGLRETLGLIGGPIRLSMRAGSENPFAPKKRRGRREVFVVMAGLALAIHEKRVASVVVWATAR
jgi:KH-domain-like of EngA bacterial GTPase enzymes, C-terminal